MRVLVQRRDDRFEMGQLLSHEELVVGVRPPFEINRQVRVRGADVALPIQQPGEFVQVADVVWFDGG